MEKSIALKGTNEGYLLFLDEHSSLEDIYTEIEDLFKKIKKEEKYTEAFDLTIDTGNRLLKDTEKEKLEKMIDEQSNFKVQTFSEKVIDKELANQWHRETSPLMVVRNVRNGQRVTSERDIILFGDIRPGGVVQSHGNIIVIGNVHGTIHAGANGNDEAVIIAPFSFDGQVRIGEHVEIIETLTEESTYNNATDKEQTIDHQIVFLNDLYVIEFAPVDTLAQVRPNFAKDLGGFEEWQKQL